MAPGIEVDVGFFPAEAPVQLDAISEVSHYSPIDLVLTVLVTITMTLGAICAFFVKGKLKYYDNHVADATTKDQALAILQIEMKSHAEQQVRHEANDDRRFDELKESLEKNTRTTEWVGDCVIASKLGDPIPPRP